VALATDVAALMVTLRDTVRAEDAYVLAMECVRASDRILKARRENFPWEASARFLEARTAALRAMIALDRAGAHSDIPRRDADGLHRRLHELALALGALARREEA
jgi:hypothetical protein